jgi:citrate synthase
MQEADTGSVIVTEQGKVVGILTERDLLRAAAAAGTPSTRVGLWMTAHPDVLSPDEKVDAAWASLTAHHYRHLPVVEGEQLVGVVSLRDLMGMARIRPAAETSGDVPAGLEGVVVAETTVGDVRGRKASSTTGSTPPSTWPSGGRSRTSGTSCSGASCPTPPASAAFAAEVRAGAPAAGLRALLPALAAWGRRSSAAQRGLGARGRAGLAPDARHRADELYDQALGLCAVVPTILAAAHRLREGSSRSSPRTTSASRPTTCSCSPARSRAPQHARAIEQYMILTIDHGFNASTFTARVITSTGADLGAAIVGAIGALSGPLHGGAPSRALDMLDAIGTADRAEAYIRRAVERRADHGIRPPRLQDRRSPLAAAALGHRAFGGTAGRVLPGVERTTVDVLAELKPGRQLYTNVEFYAGVVMHTCGIPRHMFTPTFAAGRTIGWSTHVMEQASHNRLIRPAARYVGPPPPQPRPRPTGGPPRPNRPGRCSRPAMTRRVGQ